MEDKQGATVPAQSLGCHRMPQTASLGRNIRKAQSKSNTKINGDYKLSDEAAVLHVDGTSKIVKIFSDSTEVSDVMENFEEFDKSANVQENDSFENLKQEQDEKLCAKGEQDASLIARIKQRQRKKSVKASDEEEICVVKKKRAYRKRSQSNKDMADYGVENTADLAGNRSVKNDIAQGDSENPNWTSEQPSNISDESFSADSGGKHIPRSVWIYPIEVPTLEQKEKMVSTASILHDHIQPPLYVEGDMLWAHISGHPYWPCMVSSCPFTGLTSRTKGDVRLQRLYHVQFFGDEAERGWVSASSFLFEGKTKFLARAQTESPKPSKPGRSQVNPFKVSAHRQHAWTIAVAEAELAFALPVEDRKEQYLYHYVFVGDKTNRQVEAPPPEDVSPLENVPMKLSPKKKRKRNESEGDSSPNNAKRYKHNDDLEVNQAAQEISFDAYYLNKYYETAEQHLEWDSTQIEEFLKEQWLQESLPKKKRSKKKPKSEQTPDKDVDGLKSPQSTGKKRGRKSKWMKQDLDQNRSPDLKAASSSDQAIKMKKKVGRPKKTPDPKENQTLNSQESSSAPLKTSRVTSSVADDSSEKANDDPLKTSSSDQAMKMKKKTGRPKKTPDPKENQTLNSQESSEKANEDPLKERTPAKKLGRPRKSSAISFKDILKSPKELLETSPGINGSPGVTSLHQFETPDSANEQNSGSTKKHGKHKKKTSSLSVPLVAEISEIDTDHLKLTTPALTALKPSHDSDSSSSDSSRSKQSVESYKLEILKLYSTCKIEQDNVCVVCEKNGDVLMCTGSCGQYFHASCLDLSVVSADSFKCAECVANIHSCFTCKSSEGVTKKCSVGSCFKYYHEECAKAHRLTRLEGRGFTCPMHTCATCAVDNLRNPKATKGRLYRCVRCPTSYHVGDLCIAAGSFVLAGSNILCSKHFQPTKGVSQHSRMNVPWCFGCSKGGSLLCCESCPASFHADCVEMEKAPEGAWYCMDCKDGRQPLYGDIVWIKVGIYRWWPGEICHPMNVPLNIQERAHQVGEFPCRFFGSHDYYWLHKGRVFLFQEGDKGSRDRSSSGLFKIYSRGVQEATEAYKVWTAHKLKKEEQEQERSEKKPAPYKPIKTNIPIGNVQLCKVELSEIPRCECKPDQEMPCETDCLNRMMMYECHPSVCLAGDKCHNQRFQKRTYPECQPARCSGRGWGLQCNQDIKKGQFVYEYVGDLIDEEECKKRIEQCHEDNITNFYMLTMDKNRIIDAGPKGNLSRFMNHSCCPNLETQKWMVNGDIRVGLFALDDIPKGSELTFNYNLECIGNEKKACACGAENCSGFLGVRPKTAAAAANEKKAKDVKKKRKKKLEQRKEYEDQCFRCGEGGELVMCDKGTCPKVYHLQCLKLTKPPTGKWLCPWHHCDDCGKLATSKCYVCPNSYCVTHTEGNIVLVDQTLICTDHSDLSEVKPMASLGKGQNGHLSSTDLDSADDSLILDSSRSESASGTDYGGPENSKTFYQEHAKKRKGCPKKRLSSVVKEESEQKMNLAVDPCDSYHNAVLPEVKVSLKSPQSPVKQKNPHKKRASNDSSKAKSNRGKSPNAKSIIKNKSAKMNGSLHDHMNERKDNNSDLVIDIASLK